MECVLGYWPFKAAALLSITRVHKVGHFPKIAVIVNKNVLLDIATFTIGWLSAACAVTLSGFNHIFAAMFLHTYKSK